MVVVMVGSFCLCYVPYAALAMYMVNNRNHGLDLRLVTIPAFFSKSACVYNPIIYCFMNKQVPPGPPRDTWVMGDVWGHLSDGDILRCPRTSGDQGHPGTRGQWGHPRMGSFRDTWVMGTTWSAQGHLETRDTQTHLGTRVNGGHLGNGDISRCPRILGDQGHPRTTGQ